MYTIIQWLNFEFPCFRSYSHYMIIEIFNSLEFWFKDSTGFKFWESFLFFGWYFWTINFRMNLTQYRLDFCFSRLHRFMQNKRCPSICVLDSLILVDQVGCWSWRICFIGFEFRCRLFYKELEESSIFFFFSGFLPSFFSENFYSRFFILMILLRLTKLWTILILILIFAFIFFWSFIVTWVINRHERSLTKW